MTITVRFAPSPTGLLHIGNIRTALLNWLSAHQQGGVFILRLDDTDRERSRDEYAEAIRQDLTWLGLTWDREARQSDRTARYEEAAVRMKAAGRLYPCFESEDELDRRRKRQLARGMPPIYDRAALKLDPEAITKLEADGRRPHWRFRLANEDPSEPLVPVTTLVSWLDGCRGDQAVDIGSLSDPVMIREDGTFLYTFTSVVDDAEMGVSDVIRGEDHVTNTAVQIQLFEALGAEPPRFAHHSLLVGADGQALSKRLGALSIASFREMGLEPMAVASHAALLGTSDAIEPHRQLDELARMFALDKLSRAPGRFDVEDLRQLNAKLLHMLTYEDVAPRLAAMGITGGATFWDAVKGNLSVLTDAAQWWQVVAGTVAPVVENAALAAEAIALLPAEPWDEATWGTWTAAVRAKTGLKGRDLFHPLRLALTGRDKGPELKVLLPLIGRERALRRLTGEMA